MEDGELEIDRDLDELPSVRVALFTTSGELIYGRVRFDLPFVEGEMRTCLLYTSGIMYSGGCIDIPAHSSTADEFNMWFDPEATKITLNTPWAEQVIMPNDCAFEITKTVDVYDRVAAKQDESIPAKMLAEHEYNSFYSNDGTSKDAADIWGYVWDLSLIHI